MKLSKQLLTTFLATSTPLISAFSTSTSRAFARPSFVPSTTVTAPVRSFCRTTSLNMANVMKLTDPEENLLSQVDVFIFDCDGVIWRVCSFF